MEIEATRLSWAGLVLLWVNRAREVRRVAGAGYNINRFAATSLWRRDEASAGDVTAVEAICRVASQQGQLEQVGSVVMPGRHSGDLKSPRWQLSSLSRGSGLNKTVAEAT